MPSPDGVQNAEQTIGTAFHGEAPPELHTHFHAAIQHASHYCQALQYAFQLQYYTHVPIPPPSQYLATLDCA